MYCIKIPKKDIWRHRNHIQNHFFLEFNPENMPAVENVGFSYNWQGFIYLIQIIHWFKIQIGLLNGSPSKVGMLVTIEIFFAFSTVVWPKRNSTSTVTQIYLIQLRRYNFQKCGFNYFRCENRFYCVADLLSVWTNRSVDNFLELFAQPGANRHLLRAKDG